MPKRLKQQRRGKGKPKYKSPSHKYAGKASYRTCDEKEKADIIGGKIIDLVNCPGRTAPLMLVEYETKEKVYLTAPEGVGVGDEIFSGVNAKLRKGNVLPINKIPEGTQICNIELRPGDGGKLVRGAGTSARVVLHEDKKTIIQLPSKSIKKVPSNSRAMIGKIAGGGRLEKPFVKAGKKFHAMKAKSKVWPVVAGVAMAPASHPFGGGSRSDHKQKAVSRRAPPGRKVGSIAPKRFGRKKRRK